MHDWYVLFFVFAGKGKLVSKDSKEYKQLLSDTSVLSESNKEQGNVSLMSLLAKYCSCTSSLRIVVFLTGNVLFKKLKLQIFKLLNLNIFFK